MSRKTSIWVGWLVLVAALAAFFSYRLWASPDRGIFLIGETTSGHHQIELACDACHLSPFGGGEVLQESCINCHGAELDRADDSHPRSKFTDPRNADRVAMLDARYCVTCHREHQPEMTRPMGVTLPEDFCFHCHRDIAEDRPSHAGMAFDSCASAGCHNFHDNRALYEDFLVKHAGEPDLRAQARVRLRRPPPLDGTALTAAEQDAPAGISVSAEVLHEWAASAHARAEVNCSGCHQPQGAPAWFAKPGFDQCAGCHEAQAEGFLAGKHGMRLAQDLRPMRPAMAHLPMKADAADAELGCVSCHGAHDFDTRHAAVEACLGCHDDEHSRAFRASLHFATWQRELAGEAPPGTGVSCATCHLPREAHKRDGETVTVVQHNQNDNLRPNEKMLRSVCMNCHGLGFALDALADPRLIRTNFNGRPGRHIESLDMSLERLE